MPTEFEVGGEEARGPAPVTRILLVEDNPGDARLVREHLSEDKTGRFQLAHVLSLAAAARAVAHSAPDVILLDLMLPDSYGIETVVRAQSVAPNTPIVVLTGVDDEELAVRAVRARAQEYLIKGEIDLDRLTRSILQAIERHRLQIEVASFAETLLQNGAKFREVISHSADGILVSSQEGRVLFANPAAEALLGRDLEGQLGRIVRLPLLPDRTDEIQLASGLVVELRVANIMWEAGPAWLVSLRDISGHRKSEAALRRLNHRLQFTNSQLELLAHVDPLTELSNRRGMERLLAAELSRSARGATRLIACLIDCDDFKGINGSHGHAAGDQVLREVGRRLRDSLRPSDHIARVGGDEFLVLLPDTRTAEGCHIAERLRASVASRQIALPSGFAHVTVSVGLASLPPSVGSIEEILRVVDAALRSSKARGKNLVSGADGSTPFAQDAAGRVDEAGLRTVASPIQRLSDEREVALEVVLRGGSGALARAGDTSPMSANRAAHAEAELERLEASLAKVRKLERGTFERLHVNVSPATLLGGGLSRLLELAGPPGAPRLCLELSDQQLVGGPSALQDHFATLKRAGLLTALDEVGFGRTTLESLIVLEPDFVKLDPSMVKGSGVDPAKEASLRRMVKVAVALGSEIIADGVESRADLELLKRLGVGYGQGTLWGEPRAF